jgi:hypothetical protein
MLKYGLLKMQDAQKDGDGRLRDSLPDLSEVERLSHIGKATAIAKTEFSDGHVNGDTFHGWIDSLIASEGADRAARVAVSWGSDGTPVIPEVDDQLKVIPQVVQTATLLGQLDQWHSDVLKASKAQVRTPASTVQKNISRAPSDAVVRLRKIVVRR